MRVVGLEGRGELGEWREAARRLLLAGVPPEAVEWRQGTDASADLFDQERGVSEQKAALKDATPALTVPRLFLDLAATAICHADPVRFGVLYRVLHRLQRDRNLLDVATDGDVATLHALAKSVRRDSHKMTAFVRFKEVGPCGDAERRRFVAWFEPDHYIVARVAPFFHRRFFDMDWMIATPRGIAAWDGKVLEVSSIPGQKTALSDDTEELWRTYFSSIFNPARLKVRAMQAEMPKKYWKNLPEASLIPAMIAGAEASVVAMGERMARDPPAFHARIEAAANAPRDAPPPLRGTLEELRAEAAGCTRCPLHCSATQTVFGEGPADAPIMIVGEQPGDQEDLAGRPFVGPAGRLFDAVAHEAGLDRRSLYITNAVKHFKYEMRGKRRLHQRPDAGEVEHCRWWLDLELALVKPSLVVAMGATALFALTGERPKISDVRGTIRRSEHGPAVFVTVHPSFLLRIPDAARREVEMAHFKQDLAAVAALAAPGA
jgi:probable DNA metabolism protein